MSKIIEFDPRYFSTDKRSKNSFAARDFIDLPAGSTEAWEVGGGTRSRTLLVSDTTLQKYTGYVFRFGMTGGIDISGRKAVQIMIFPENNFDRGYAYMTEFSRTKPVLSKRYNSDILHILCAASIHSVNCSSISFVGFPSFHAITILCRLVNP